MHAQAIPPFAVGETRAHSVLLGHSRRPQSEQSESGTITVRRDSVAALRNNTSGESTGVR